MREENEGYAKLLLELFQDNICADNCDLVIGNIQKLIGFFSLNPARVLDILLTSFEHNLDNSTYLTLLEEFGSG